MFFLRRVRSWLGAKPIIVLPERRLPAETEGTPSASLHRLVPARAGLILSRTFTGTSGSYACVGLGTTCRG
jgi:hypothetical protein